MSLQQVVEALAADLGKGVTLDDAHGRVVAYSLAGETADTARTQAILERASRPEVRAWEERHLIGRSGLVGVPANEALGLGPRTCAEVSVDGRVRGRVWLAGPGSPLTEAQRQRVWEAVAALAGSWPEDEADAAGDAAGPGDVRSREGLVRQVLAGDVDAWRTLVARLRGPRPAAVRVAALVGEGRSRLAGVKGVKGVRGVTGVTGLTGVPGVLGAVEDAGVVLALLAAQAPGGDDGSRASGGGSASAMGAELREAAAGQAGRRVVVGLGSAQDVAAIPRSAQEARQAARAALLDPALGGVAVWDRLVAHRAVLSDVELPDLLAPLAARGREELLLTIATFLDLAGDVGATAARLHLHRSTVYYRLAQAEEALGIDLGNGIHRLDVHLALLAGRLA